MKQPHSLFITYNGALEPLIQSQGIPYLRGLTEKGIKISLLSFEKREYRRQKQEIARLEAELSRHGIKWYWLPHFIEEVYNLKKLHSALDYRLPNEFEELVVIQQNNGVPCQTLLTLPVQS